MTKNAQLEAARLRHGWQQATLAQKLGVSLQTYRAWENNKSEPSLSYLRAMCTLFQESPDALGFCIYVPQAGESQQNERLVAARLARQWSQKQAAELLGVRVAQYERWESCTEEPTDAQRQQLRELFGLSLDALGFPLEDTGPVNASPGYHQPNTWLVKARTRRHLTQKEIAARIGVSGSTVHAWEIGERVPTLENLWKLCELLDLPPDQIGYPPYQPTRNPEQEKSEEGSTEPDV